MYKELLERLAEADGGPEHRVNWDMYTQMLGAGLVALETGDDLVRALMLADQAKYPEQYEAYANLARVFEESVA